MVRTTSSGSYRYGIETAFKTSPTNLLGNYGIAAKITQEVDNSEKAYVDLGERIKDQYSYGELKAMTSVTSVLSDPWSFSLFLSRINIDNVESGDGVNGVALSEFSAADEPVTATIETRFKGETKPYVYKHLGAVVKSAGLSSSLGGDVEFKFDFEAGNVVVKDITAATFAKFPRNYNAPKFPFTFRYGGIMLGGVPIAEVESFGCDIQTGSGLQYDHGTEEATSAFAGELDVTGNLKYSVKDKSAIERVVEPESNNNADLIMTFKNMAAVKAGYSEIKLTFRDVSYSKVKQDHSGLDRVYDDCTWQAKDVTVQVKNQYRNPFTKLTAGNMLLGAPTLTATPGSNAMALSVSEVNGATKYRIYGGTKPRPIVPIGADATRNQNHTGLTTGAKYYYVAVALKNGVVISQPSAEVSAVAN